MLAHAFKLLLSPQAETVILSPSRSEVDITDVASVARVYGEFRPTLVLNCAAHTKVDLCDYQRDLAYAINADAAGHLARLAGQGGVQMVHFSTDFVFSGPSSSSTGWREVDATNPQSTYGSSKLAGEMAVRANHPAALVVRTSWLYGPGGACFPATMVKAARAGKPLSVVADQRGSPTYTLDLARAALDLVQHGATGVFHVSNTGETTWHAFAQETLRLFGLPNEVTPITTQDWEKRVPWSAARPTRSTLDTSKLQAAIGRPMRAWQDALKDYVARNCV